MLENGLKAYQMISYLKKIRVRTILTFSAIMTAIIVFTISYMVCEIQEIVFETLHN